jgi:hypothetical protein
VVAPTPGHTELHIRRTNEGDSSASDAGLAETAGVDEGRGSAQGSAGIHQSLDSATHTTIKNATIPKKDNTDILQRVHRSPEPNPVFEMLPLFSFGILPRPFITFQLSKPSTLLLN